MHLLFSRSLYFLKYNPTYLSSSLKRLVFLFDRASQGNGLFFKFLQEGLFIVKLHLLMESMFHLLVRSPSILWENRKGRCGKRANCFTLYRSAFLAMVLVCDVAIVSFHKCRFEFNSNVSQRKLGGLSFSTDDVR
ncbi:hypothetical protein FRX31_009506 [Thalictrum thalictroides]|uniref:Uncharacterized protein n=1 Tax=Thalictrum thalictroides TaxID=46969 RepID=A0A7J6WVH3_THATH|nr:hypothetical protein FRX31_009506 [Thalictrum thalictroides]